MRKIIGFLPFILCIILGTAFIVWGAAVLIYDWQLNLTAATPAVRFYRWSDGYLNNSLSLSYNIYADLWLYDANASWGIRNTHATNDKIVQSYINSVANTTALYNVTIKIIHPNSTVVATLTWQGGSLPTTPQTWTAVASTTYTIRIWLKGASSVSNTTVALKNEVSE